MNDIDKLKKEIQELKQTIKGLERDLDYVVENSNNTGSLKYCIEELQEEVAKLANQPVGILFTRMK
jgi:archaellum component FlaC